MMKNESAAIKKRYVSVKELQEYTSLSRPCAIEVAKAAGAYIHYSSHKILCDIQKIDEYMESLRTANRQ